MPSINVGRYIAGVGFCFIGAMLYALDRCAMAIIGTNLNTVYADLGKVGTAARDNGSDTVRTLSIIAAVIGILFLIAAEVDARRVRRSA